MNQERADSSKNGSKAPYQKAVDSNYYTLLGLHPSASVRDIRQAYRELSKLYHPDTTQLPSAIATQKFQQLNEAYATLSNPERRVAYDQKIGYSRVIISQPLPSLSQPQPKSEPNSSAYLDPTDRPLSAGELFALFILGITFIACLILAITIGITKGEEALYPITAKKSGIREPVEVLKEVEATMVKSLPKKAPELKTPELKTPELRTAVKVPQPTDTISDTSKREISTPKSAESEHPSSLSPNSANLSNKS